MKNIKAFSLIELSIVLIIIGFVITSIVGGSKLIENAKLKVAIDELTSLERVVYNFKFLKGRLPGDLNASGFIGNNSTQTYNNKSFGEPYVNTNKNYGIPAVVIAPFVDLYLAKLIDFEPKKTVPATGKLTGTNGGSMPSKVFDCYYRFITPIAVKNVNSVLYKIEKKAFIRCINDEGPAIKLS